MDSNDLTTDQAEIMRNRIRPLGAYLHRVWRRMEKLNFPKNDELFQATAKADDAAHSLWVTLHYMSCASGVCRPPRRRGPPPPG